MPTLRPRETIASVLRDAVARFPDRPALLAGEQEISFAGLSRRVERLRGQLSAHGTSPGDRVAIALDNSIDHVATQYAVAQLGCIAVPVHRPIRGPMLDGVAVVTERDGDITITGGAEPGRRDPPPSDRVGPDDPAVLYRSSGTTGEPKGILLSHRQILFGIEAWTRRWEFDRSTRSLMVAPFCHVVFGPLVIGAHLHGGAAVIPDNLRTRAAARAIERHRVTAVMGTPSFFAQLLHDESSLSRDLGSLDALIYGAAPTPVAIIEALGQRFPSARRFNCYGLTETASALSCLGPEEVRGREASVGRAHPGVEISIRDERGVELPEGREGEVCCRGPNVITRYHDARDATATRFHDGWLRTGDIGTLDGDGYLYLLGRADDVINVAGQKIYPREVEEVLHRHPAVLETSVAGVPDLSKGQVVVATVVPRPGREVGAIDLRRFCIASLPIAFVPKRFEFVEDLSRNPTGKVMRRS